jgi:hypothetical protein
MMKKAKKRSPLKKGKKLGGVKLQRGTRALQRGGGLLERGGGLLQRGSGVQTE